MDPRKVRPKRDWVLVLDDKRESTTKSGLIIPMETGAEKVTEWSGSIVSVGLGDKNGALGLKPDQRVVYRRYLKHANKLDVDELWDDGSKKEYFLMSTDDIMGVIDSGTTVGVLSSAER